MLLKEALACVPARSLVVQSWRGNHVSASAGTLKRQGLFLNLGTAYTYTL
jgi:hypothetical protein